MKKIVSVIFVLIFSLLFTASCGAAEYTASISIEGTAATVTGAPPNSTLIAAFYEGGALTGIEPERGSGTITVDFSDKLPGADRVKVFLWDMENIYPLCPAKEIDEVKLWKIRLHRQRPQSLKITIPYIFVPTATQFGQGLRITTARRRLWKF